MTAEQIQRLIDGAHAIQAPAGPAWQVALQLAFINEKLAVLIDLQKFRSPGYDEAFEECLKRARQRQTETPERPPEANK